MHINHKSRLIPLVLLALAGTYGCGDDDGGSDTDMMDSGTDDTGTDDTDDTGTDDTDDTGTDDTDDTGTDDTVTDDTDTDDGGDEDSGAPTDDAGAEPEDAGADDAGMDDSDAGPDSGMGDVDGGGIEAIALCAGMSGTALEECGGYIVNTVAHCGGCHAEDLSGQEVRGSFAPNLTNDATGLADWTDDEIKEAFLNGVRPDGEALGPAMPYRFLHNMAGADADAIVAYLRTVPGIDNPFPGLQNPDGGAPLPRPEVDAPAPPFDVANLPATSLDPSDSDYAAAMRGQYIVGYMGVCIDCHTPRENNQMDLANLLTGGRGFGPPPNPPTSSNLTPHADGLAGWTAQMVRTALIEGTDDEGLPLCAPMPAGPDGALADLSEADALAIGQYLTTIPPKANPSGQPYPQCPLPDAGP